MIDWGKERILELKLAADSGRIDGQHKSPIGTLALPLQRADGPRQCPKASNGAALGGRFQPVAELARVSASSPATHSPFIVQEGIARRISPSAWASSGGSVA